MLSQGALGCINKEIPALPSPDLWILLAIFTFHHRLPNTPSLAQCNRDRHLENPTHLRFIYRSSKNEGTAASPVTGWWMRCRQGTGLQEQCGHSLPSAREKPLLS